MTGAPICFIDTETISLARDHRHLWEIALIIPATFDPGTGRTGDIHRSWLLDEVPLGEADSRALDVGRFYERYKPSDAKPRAEIARAVSRATWGLHLVGAVPSFDEQRLWDFLRAHGAAPGWHYHLVDVEALAAGAIARSASESGFVVANIPGHDDLENAHPPWDSHMLSLAVGVNPDDFDRHTALGDCRWAKAMYKAVMKEAP